MVRKPRDYSAEYRRRIASGQRRGLTRQQARGHGRGEAGRSPPRSLVERQESKERGVIIKKYKAVLRQSGRDPRGGLPLAEPFKGSALNPAYRRKSARVIFTFEGVPIEGEISPKLQDQLRDSPKAFQAVPIQVESVGEMLTNFEEYKERAASQTSLVNPTLVDVYVLKRTLGE